VHEAAAVHDRLPSRPADPLEQLGHRLGEHGVAAEVREPAAQGPPACRPGARRDDDLGGPDAAAVGSEQTRLDRLDVRLLVQDDAGCERVPTQRAHKPSGLHRRALPYEDAAPEAGRTAALRHLAGREGHGLLLDAEVTCRGHERVQGPVLGRRRRDLEEASPAEPDVVVERLDGIERPLRRPRHGERAAVAEERAQLGQARPVAVQEAAVAPARPAAANVALEEDDA
jgi:hypothetical protein